MRKKTWAGLVVSVVFLAGQSTHAQIQIEDLGAQAKQDVTKSKAEATKLVQELRSALKKQQVQTKETQAALTKAWQLLRELNRKQELEAVPNAPDAPQAVDMGRDANVVLKFVPRDARPISRPEDLKRIQVSGDTPSDRVKNADELIRALDEARTRLVKEQDKARAELKEKTKP
jgi:ElaB/YqjD/DUF883 family membrane-anchored ribosome-binding protein